jgi:hypothetical protein
VLGSNEESSNIAYTLIYFEELHRRNRYENKRPSGMELISSESMQLSAHIAYNLGRQL